MALQLYNTLHRRKEEFKALDPRNVLVYACGPTVYNYAHIGNLRTYIFEDLLRRTLSRAGFGLTHAMNITDVGHLQSDADDGEDKMALAAAREKKSPWELAKFYEEAFFDDCRHLSILKPHIVCRATDHIPEMQQMIAALEKKGYAYKAGGNTPNIYFDTAKFPSYPDFARLPPAQGQARVDTDENKRNAADFVLWFTLEGSKYPNQIMKWESAWGTGFPGWHIECSAMASKYLGERIDIHCGGIDHIPVHHTNEVAQSEACFGHQWVNYWLHGEFLLMADDGKMSKSKDGFMTLQKLVEAGYSPLHYRYLCLTAHYRGPLKFSFESLDAARQAYDTLCHKADEWRRQAPPAAKLSAAAKEAIQRLDAAMQDDLNSPVALALLWEVLRGDALPIPDKLAVLDAADSALGLGGATIATLELNREQDALVIRREEMRRNKQWQEADEIRAQLSDQGLLLKDRPEGTSWYKK